MRLTCIICPTERERKVKEEEWTSEQARSISQAPGNREGERQREKKKEFLLKKFRIFSLILLPTNKGGKKYFSFPPKSVIWKEWIYFLEWIYAWWCHLRHHEGHYNTNCVILLLPHFPDYFSFGSSSPTLIVKKSQSSWEQNASMLLLLGHPTDGPAGRPACHSTHRQYLDRELWGPPAATSCLLNSPFLGETASAWVPVKLACFGTAPSIPCDTHHHKHTLINPLRERKVWMQ